QGGGGGVEVEGELELVERFLVETAVEQAAAGGGVLLGGAQPRPLQALAVVEVVRVLLHRLRVLEHRAVVVLPALRVLAGPEGAGGGAARHQEGHGGGAELHPAITSTPRGTSNRKS